jgi:hypothetical protein
MLRAYDKFNVEKRLFEVVNSVATFSEKLQRCRDAVWSPDRRDSGGMQISSLWRLSEEAGNALHVNLNISQSV